MASGKNKYAGVIDPHRKFDRCIFCENAANSREHIIAKWANELIRPPRNAVGTVLRAKEDGCAELTHVKFPSPITGLTSQCVCKACNNGWMSRIVSAAKPTLKELINGTYCGSLHLDEQMKLYRHFAIMGMIVDANNAQTLPFFDRGARARFRLSLEQLSSARVYLGRTNTFVDDPPFNTAFTNFRTRRGKLLTTPHKMISTVLGHLAVAIHLGRTARPMPIAYEELGKTSNLAWPPAFSVDFLDLARLQNRDDRGQMIFTPIAS